MIERTLGMRLSKCQLLRTLHILYCTERIKGNNSEQGYLLFFVILHVCFHEFIFIITSIVVVWIVANEIQAELCNLLKQKKQL